MIYISTARTVWNKFANISPFPGTFNHDLNITPEVFEYKFVHVDTGRIVWHFKITLDELKKHKSFSDQSWWCCYDNAFVPYGREPIPVFITDGCPYMVDIKTEQIASLLDITKERKSTQKHLWMKHEDGVGQVPVRFFVPYSSGDFTNFVYQVTYPRNSDKGDPPLHDVTLTCNIDHNFEIDTINKEFFQPHWKWFFSPITISSDDSKNFIVTLSDPSVKNLKSFVGELPKQITTDFHLEDIANNISEIYIKTNFCEKIVPIKNGTGEFFIDTTSLPIGTEFTVSAGYKLLDEIETCIFLVK